MADIAESAITRTPIAEYQKGGCALGKTLKDIGAVGFLANRVQPFLADQMPGLLILGATGQTAAQPTWFPVGGFNV
jgi:hypothetical protein